MFPTKSAVPVFNDEDPSIFDPAIFLEEDVVGEGHEVTEKGGTVKKRARKSSSAVQIHDNKIDGESKKTAHREMEKQRRHEMAGLYASLRSLLPLDYVKGKRAISDHMDQAVNYIKDMQKKIDEMKTRRDNLSKMLSSVPGAAAAAENRNSNTRFSQFCAKLNLLGDGMMEILISSGLNEESFPLSKVLAELFGRGFNVIACVSTRSDHGSIYQLQIELKETTSIDLSELQDRLLNLIRLA